MSATHRYMMADYQKKYSLPVAIVRPTLISSVARDPYPGMCGLGAGLVLMWEEGGGAGYLGVSASPLVCLGRSCTDRHVMLTLRDSHWVCVERGWGVAAQCCTGNSYLT